jgi:hypothetical protein
MPKPVGGDDRSIPTEGHKLYALEFVNQVRTAQGCAPLDHLPVADADAGPLELAMGCRFEGGLMRMSSPAAAQAVANATGLPLGFDRVTIALPPALSGEAPKARATPLADSLPRSEAV